MENKPVVGIAYTTRNRPDLLTICLRETFKYLSPEKYEYVVVVVIDVGNPDFDIDYAELMVNYPQVFWDFQAERLGIARAKNECIKFLKRNKCDHFFLIDDDCFPKKKGWDELYITVAGNNGVNHLMHQIDLKDNSELVATENGICKFLGSCGSFLYFTRLAIDTVGGMRKDFKVYANEHTEIALRCHMAKLQGKWGAIMSPEKTGDYIYAIDLDLNMFGVQPNDFTIDLSKWRSSITGENKMEHAEHNRKVFEKMTPIFEEI